MKTISGYRSFLFISILIISLVMTIPVSAAPVQEEAVTQCAKGVQLYDQEKYDDALPLLETGFSGRENIIFSDINDLGICSYKLGLLKYRAKKYEAAIKVYDVALGAFQKGNIGKYEGLTTYEMGKTHYALENFEGALSSFERSLNIFQGLDDQTMAGNTLLYIGWTYSRQELYAPAESLYGLQAQTNVVTAPWRIIQSDPSYFDQAESISEQVDAINQAKEL
jgi:tetratricopeptide (TPR) repeat protein